MATVQIESYLTLRTGEPQWNIPDRYTIDSYDLGSVDAKCVTIRKQTFTVEIPDNFDPRPLQIDALRKEKQKIIAEAEAKANNIEEQIQRLLCIEAPRDPEIVL